MIRLLTAVALAAALTTPARADEPTVRLSYQHYSVPLDAGWLVVVVCGASATPIPGQVALVTEVRCSAGGVQASAVAPGGEAFTSIITPVLGSTTVCIYGETALVDVLAGHVRTAMRGPECTTVVP